MLPSVATKTLNNPRREKIKNVSAKKIFWARHATNRHAAEPALRRSVPFFVDRLAKTRQQ
jgi:hypothetical protein